MGIRDNDIVVDLGAGTGFYAVAAGQLAPRGKVYAIDIVQDYLATIRHKAKEAHLHNIEIIWGNVEKPHGTKLGNNVADVAIASNILSQAEDKDKFILEIKRILKKGGRVLLIDWSELSIMSAKVLVPKNKAREMFEKKDFVWHRDIDAGEHHYGMILGKQ